MNLASKEQVINWWNKSPENWKAATFIQQYLGSGRRGLYLKVNSKPNPVLIFRLRKSILKSLELKEIESQSVNCKYMQVFGIKQKKNHNLKFMEEFKVKYYAGAYSGTMAVNAEDSDQAIAIVKLERK